VHRGLFTALGLHYSEDCFQRVRKIRCAEEFLAYRYPFAPGASCHSAMAAVQPPVQDLPIEGKTVKALTALSLKRTFALFVENHGQKVPLDEDGYAIVWAVYFVFAFLLILCCLCLQAPSFVLTLCTQLSGLFIKSIV
jgi:hypothetical protein